MKPTDQNLTRQRVYVIQRKVQKYNMIKDKGFVYLLISEEEPEWIKVGVTTNLKSRLDGYLCHSPNKKFRYINVFESDYSRRLELLSILAFNKIALEKYRKEWFKFSEKDEPVKIIEGLKERELTFLDLYDHRDIMIEDETKARNKQLG